MLASFDGDPEADVETACASEIEHRAKEATENPDVDLSWKSVRAELHAVSGVG